MVTVYHLRRDEQLAVIPEMWRGDGTIIPARKVSLQVTAIYRNNKTHQLCSKPFRGSSFRYKGLSLYRFQNLWKAKEVQKTVFEMTGERYEIYDGNKKIETDFTGGVDNG